MNNPTILDFGGGKGFMFERQFKTFKYYNADFSKDASKERLQNNDEFIDALYIESLPINLEANSIDIIYLIEVLEHLNDDYLESTLNEIHRLLKYGGKLVLTVPNDEDLNISKNFCGCIYHKWQHVRSLNKDNIRNVLEEYNFKNINVLERTFNKTTSKVIRALQYINHMRI